MKVDSVAHEGRVVGEVKARPVLWYVALEQQLLSQLYSRAWMKHFGVPQAVDHEDQVEVELTESLTADVKGLLKKKKNRIEMRRKKEKSKKSPTKPSSISTELHIRCLLCRLICLPFTTSPFFFIKKCH